MPTILLSTIITTLIGMWAFNLSFIVAFINAGFATSIACAVVFVIYSLKEKRWE